MTDEKQAADERQAAIDAAAALANSVSAFGEDIRALKQTGKTNRQLIKALAVSIAFDIMLSVGFGWVAFRADDASHKAADATSATAQAAQRARTTCESANVARKANLDLWLYVLALPPTSPQSEAQRQRAADFRVYVTKVFAPRDCSAS